MRRTRSTFRQKFIALWCAIGLSAIPLRGAESASAPASTTAASSEQKDSINAAKREFDALKAVRDPSQQQKGGIPRFNTPELQTDSGSALTPLTRKEARPETTKKPGNWLVDAMEKNAREDQARARGEQLGRGESKRDQLTEEELLVRGEKESETKLAATDAEERTVRDTRERPEVVNPLTRYLSDWITPRDLAVLKPGLDEAASGKNAAEIRANESLQLDLPPSLAGAGSLFSTAAPHVAPAPPRENPYLQGIVGAPTTVATPFVLPPAPAIVTAPPPRAPAPVMSSAPPPVVAPPPKIPDFAKPAHNEKYFKQLKRF